MKMYLAGQWVDRDQRSEVVNPFDGKAFDTVPRANAADVEAALQSAVRGARAMEALSGHERYRVLTRAAAMLGERADDLARTITREEGKVLSEARGEVGRAVETLTASAEEAKRIVGEGIPVDAAPGVKGKLAFTLRVPCGVVAAVTPFNFPLNLVAHKLGPALAGGNAVVLKPASDTPLSALKLVEVLLDAGAPPESIQCLTGPGGELGDALVSDPRVRKVTFTGSRDVGDKICRRAGLKRVTMELGSNAPVVVLADADLEEAAAAVARSGFSNAGQSCISAQRILGAQKIYADLVQLLSGKVRALKAGDPMAEGMQVGPMVREREAARVQEWIGEAASGGARVVVGGERAGAVHAPTLVADVKPQMRISEDELFGPAVGASPFASLDEAISLCNRSRYGLSASIFTRDLDAAMRFLREVQSGNLHVNEGPAWRADVMPYGGLKESGFGKEGPRYAVEEMTELKLAVIHLRS
ncbi:MAG TPA: aldehyde dehydrogenase family protein [Myxococcaceae bacterium]|nr:aldehyde dehydrogenase family protein [Myxococcaceae bacterium]